MNDSYKDYLSGSLNPKLVIDKIGYDIQFMDEHPEYFKPDGFICFSGGQGTGKTLSAVQYIHKLVLEYPAVKVVSNIALHFPDWNGEVIPYEGYEQVQYLDNGYAGIILFIDEIQILFNSLESARMNPNWFTVISQQRKRRLHVVGTSQVFERIGKCWREQFTACVLCDNWFGMIQYNRVASLKDVQYAEGNTDEIVKVPTSATYIWFRDPVLFDYYDTWERVEKLENKKKESVKKNGSK